jgi:hypothetical protein
VPPKMLTVRYQRHGVGVSAVQTVRLAAVVNPLVSMLEDVGWKCEAVGGQIVCTAMCM